MATSIAFLKEMLQNKNVLAALFVVRHTEGTTAEDGYNYLFGSSPGNTIRFVGFDKHPGILRVENGISSTAAGAFQILLHTYDFLCSKYGFTDFTPDTQNLMFCALLDNRNCLGAVANGLFLHDSVQRILGQEWASLPLSGYGQPTHSLEEITGIYITNSGTIAA